MKFLHKVFSKLSYWTFSAILLALIAFGAGLAYHVDVALNITLGWGYIVYIIALVLLGAMLIRIGAEILFVPIALPFLMILGRIMITHKQPFFENTTRADYYFWETLKEWGGPILEQYGAIFLLVLSIAIFSTILAWVCKPSSSGCFSLRFWQPAWQSNNEDRAKKAVAKESDQKKMKEIAQKAPRLDIRVAAVNKISDQVFLLDIARHEKNSLLRKTAVTRLNEQSELALIAKTDREISVCLAALEKLESPAILLDIAKQAFGHANGIYGRDVANLSIAAAQKLTEPNDFVDVANNAKDYDTCSFAISRLEPDLLAIFAKHTTHSKLGAEALKKLNDQKVLVDIAQNAMERSIRVMAVHRLTDQSILADMAMNDHDLARDAVQRLTDQSILADIAMSDNDVAQNAAFKITDKSLLLKIWEKTKNSSARKVVLLKLGAYVCTSCNQEVWPTDEQPAPCICSHCQTENHKFEHRSDITEYRRDYEVGSTWEECVRCGQKKNYKYVNTMP